ncbi:hypothetical protein B0J11DRAFT_591907 [Dendryphion nanum]|uniref:BTB domain-containing protein n=1 Tax=Dendryphion nanum TaxID=256645 RepID=A0A9P9DF40_9PLEO|nr:hypothetical protein B0J11DRAFT_591907 [Dendryphion nanum]
MTQAVKTVAAILINPTSVTQIVQMDVVIILRHTFTLQEVVKMDAASLSRIMVDGNASAPPRIWTESCRGPHPNGSCREAQYSSQAFSPAPIASPIPQRQPTRVVNFTTPEIHRATAHREVPAVACDIPPPQHQALPNRSLSNELISLLIGDPETSSVFLVPELFQVSMEILRNSVRLFNYVKNCKDSSSGKDKCIKIDNVDPRAFRMYLEYLTTGTVYFSPQWGQSHANARKQKWGWKACWPLLNAHILATTIGDDDYADFIMDLLRETLLPDLPMCNATISHLFAPTSTSSRASTELKRFVTDYALKGGQGNFTNVKSAVCPPLFVQNALRRSVKCTELYMNVKNSLVQEYYKRPRDSNCAPVAQVKGRCEEQENVTLHTRDADDHYTGQYVKNDTSNTPYQGEPFTNKTPPFKNPGQHGTGSISPVAHPRKHFANNSPHTSHPHITHQGQPLTNAAPPTTHPESYFTNNAPPNHTHFPNIHSRSSSSSRLSSTVPGQITGIVPTRPHNRDVDSVIERAYGLPRPGDAGHGRTPRVDSVD